MPLTTVGPKGLRKVPTYHIKFNKCANGKFRAKIWHRNGQQLFCSEQYERLATAKRIVRNFVAGVKAGEVDVSS